MVLMPFIQRRVRRDFINFMAQKNELLALVGATAVGKTALALWLAERLAIEVVSADSRQVYRGLDIGTAKPGLEERQALPHHLVDVVEPEQALSLAEYQRLAYRAIEDVQQRGHLPLLAGGSGQYVRAVLEGWQIPSVPPDERLRAALQREAEAVGLEAFHARLRQIDPQAARAIDPRNVRRVIRALEVYHKTGRPISELQKRRPPPYRILKIGLTLPRPLLYRRIDERVERMIEKGLVAEVEGLLQRGYSADLPAMSGLGYRQIVGYLRGEVSLEQAVQQIKRETRRFARQQYVWFRLEDETIRWFDLSREDKEAVLEAITAFLEGG
jgi:tRNA dimethylallyltransferase